MDKMYMLILVNTNL